MKNQPITIQNRNLERYAAYSLAAIRFAVQTVNSLLKNLLKRDNTNHMAYVYQCQLATFAAAYNMRLAAEMAKA